MILLRWYLLDHHHLTSDRRKHYDDLLYRGGSLYIKCDDTGVLYVSEDDSNYQKHTNVGDWRKTFHQKQIQGRKDLREWTRSKQSVAISIEEQYTRQIQRMIHVHSTSTVIVIVRMLDALETPLDPPRFGDVVLQYPNEKNGQRRRKENEKKLLRKETVAKMMSLFATSGGGDVNDDSGGRDQRKGEDESDRRCSLQHPVLRGYHKKFRYDEDALDGVGGYDKVWRNLFDRAILTTVGKEVYEQRRREEEEFAMKRKMNGEKYRRLALEKIEAEKTGGGGGGSGGSGGGMMSELRAMQEKRKSGSSWGKKLTPAVRKMKEKKTMTTKEVEEEEMKEQREEEEEDEEEEEERRQEDGTEEGESKSTSSLSSPPRQKRNKQWRPIHSGWMLKRGSRWNSHLRHRLFVLQMLEDDDDLMKTRLAYYTSEAKCVFSFFFFFFIYKRKE